jgi:hypothetical protein
MLTVMVRPTTSPGQPATFEKERIRAMPSQKPKSPWGPLRTASAGTGKEEDAPPLPGKKGRYALYLGTGVIDPIDGKGRYVHVSWSGKSYCIRDYIAGIERREGDDLTIEQVWKRALDRIPATGDLYVSYTDGKFWKEKLEMLTAVHHSTQNGRA